MMWYGIRAILLAGILLAAGGCKGKTDEGLLGVPGKEKDGLFVFDDPVKLFVLSDNGVNVRDTPSLSGKKIATALFAEQLRVDARQIDEVEVDGRKGYWLRSTTSRWKGWIFSAFVADQLQLRSDLSHYHQYLDRMNPESTAQYRTFLRDIPDFNDPGFGRACVNGWEQIIFTKHFIFRGAKCDAPVTDPAEGANEEACGDESCGPPRALHGFEVCKIDGIAHGGSESEPVFFFQCNATREESARRLQQVFQDAGKPEGLQGLGPEFLKTSHFGSPESVRVAFRFKGEWWDTTVTRFAEGYDFSNCAPACEYSPER